jgi:hypothetical protein
MATLGVVINVSLFVTFVVATWWGPRRFGLPGMFGVHLLVGVGFLGMGYVALATGIWDRYEGGEVIIGLLIQAFAFNCLLLPVGLLAAWRHRKVVAGGGAGG